MPSHIERTDSLTRKNSVIEQLEQLDEANNLTFKDNYDEVVLDFVKKWQKLLEDYDYKEVMTLEFIKADHPYPEPAFPIKIMDQEEYMTNHYSSVYRWARVQKRATEFHVIEIRDSKVIGAINISGPFNEYPLFQAFIDICIYTRTLSVIRLIGCSLKKESVMMVGECLPRTGVTHLYLDRNPIADEDYSSILENNTILVHLSLAMCKIGFKGMQALSRVLGPYEGSKPKQNLKSLALDDNDINCLVIKSFAECLRWNTDLVFLSLAGNLIGDRGLEYLSASFYASEMSDNEIDMMNCRHIERIRELEDIVNEELHLPIVEIPNMEVDIFEDNNYIDKAIDTDYPKDRIRIDPIRRHAIQQTCDEFLEMDPNPIVANVTISEGKLIGGGNYTLNVLNISYNKIREKGFLCLLNALREQHLADTLRAPTETGYNLKIIEYMGNPCPEDSKIYQKIDYYLKLSNKKVDVDKYPSDPCSCIPFLKPNIDSETLLVYDEAVEYFKPTEEEEEESEESEEAILEWECCSEFTDTEYELSSSDGTAEENDQHINIEETYLESESSLYQIEPTEEMSYECTESSTGEEETEEKQIEPTTSY